MTDPILNIGTEETNYPEIVVCLFDGDYHLGLASLINSLVKSNFKGLVHAGYRGDLPAWTSQLKKINPELFYITNEINLCFRHVDTDIHLGYYKPYFIKETFDLYKSSDKIYYFDTDIIVKAPWSFFSNWLKKGLCLCADNSFYFLHHTHPWRKDWKKLAPEDETNFNNTDYYFNSGFLGIERKSIAFITRWIYFTQKYIETDGNIYEFDKDDFQSIKGDQDLMNAAITMSPDIEMSIVGKDGMGFTLPATIMVHAVGYMKPWNNRFFKRLIRSGHKPNLGDKSFFANCKYPIRIFSNYKYQIKKLDIFIASFCGRILG